MGQKGHKIEVGNQKSDGLILDTEEKMIYIIEERDAVTLTRQWKQPR